jgi:hypothetical protein
MRLFAFSTATLLDVGAVLLVSDVLQPIDGLASRVS